MNWKLTSGEASESFIIEGRGGLLMLFIVIAAGMMFYFKPGNSTDAIRVGEELP